MRKTINGQDMVLSHYAFRTWDKAHKGTWMLHGHSHGTLPVYENFKQLDVGIDTHLSMFHLLENNRYLIYAWS